MHLKTASMDRLFETILNLKDKEECQYAELINTLNVSRTV